MFRIDPITEEGIVDLEFFSSDEYQPESEVLLDYLHTEGFTELTDKFFIDFRGRKWEVTPKRNKK